MASLDELRARWATKPTKADPDEKPAPSGSKDLSAQTFGIEDAIVWSEGEVRGWAKTGDVITAGKVVGSGEHVGVAVTDFRFKSGRFAGKTVRVAASTNGRGYLRWWYSQITASPLTEGMLQLVRQVLGEGDEVIKEKAAAHG